MRDAAGTGTKLHISTPIPAKPLCSRMRDGDRAGAKWHVSTPLPAKQLARPASPCATGWSGSAGAAINLNVQLPEAQVPTVAPSP